MSGDDHTPTHECGAIPPNVRGPVPCHLAPGHGGPHFSTSGCAGSEIRWHDNPNARVVMVDVDGERMTLHDARLRGGVSS